MSLASVQHLCSYAGLMRNFTYCIFAAWFQKFRALRAQIASIATCMLSCTVFVATGAADDMSLMHPNVLFMYHRSKHLSAERSTTTPASQPAHPLQQHLHPLSPPLQQRGARPRPCGQAAVSKRRGCCRSIVRAAHPTGGCGGVSRAVASQCMSQLLW